MSDPFSRLIDALAAAAVEDYLTEQAPPPHASSEPQAKPVPLSDMGEAA